MKKESIPSEPVPTEQTVNEEIDWEKASGRDKYFKPQNNKDHDIVARNWKPYEQSGNSGIVMEVIKVDGVEYADPIKLWTTTSKRTIRELEPIIKAATNQKKDFIHVLFRKSLGKGQKDTDAVFTAKNLDVDIDHLVPDDQKSDR